MAESFEPQVFEKLKLAAIVNRIARARRELVHYLECEIFASQFVPISLQRFVRMAAGLKLKLVTINNSRKIQTGADKHLVVEVVSDEENAHRLWALLVILLELFVRLFQEKPVATV